MYGRMVLATLAACLMMMMVEVKGQGCTITDGVDYKSPSNNAYEGRLTTLYILDSAAVCCSSCATFAECKYFAYNKADKSCNLKTSVVVAYANSNFQGGVSPQSVPNRLSSSCSSPVSGIDYDNGFLGSALYSVQDLGTCCNACKNYTGCNYYGYASSNKACYLKGSNANPSSNGGVTSGTIMTESKVTQRTGKRGLGVFNTVSCSDMKLLNSVSWVYNWAAQPQNELRQCYKDLGIEYVPMQWGLPLALQNIDTSAKWLLGFNEPNFKSQSNISPQDAAAAWPQIQDFAQKNGMQLVSPSASAGGDSDAIKWLDDFFAACPSCHVDAIATHIYSCYPGGVKGYTDGFKKYGKPIWLTEFSCADWEYSNPNIQISDWAGMVTYLNKTLNLIEADPQYARYAYFGTGRGDKEGVGKFSNIYDASKSALSPLGVEYIYHGQSSSATSASSTTSATSASVTAAATVTGVSSSTTTGSSVPPSKYPVYVGCYIDNKTGRDLVKQVGGTSAAVMTVDLCVSLCVLNKKTYAGLQYAKECFCGNAYGRQGGKVEDSQCNMPCTGNATQICGAGSRNSIYQVMDPVSATESEDLPSSASSSFSSFSLVACFCFVLFFNGF